MQRQAKRELRHGVAFTKALLQYEELAHHEKADVAEQAAEEYRHFAIIKDYLLARGEDVEGELYMLTGAGQVLKIVESQ